MKVILKKDVKGLGKTGDIVECNNGYGRNYLLPRELAIEANSKNINIAESRRNAKEHKDEIDLKKANKLAAKVSGTEVDMKVKAGENGKLFGSITSKDIAAELQKKIGIKIDKKKINLAENIKEIGTYDLEVKLYPGISAQIKVNVK